ncbi:unnamed protein product [Polarella glacialis]|uniref:Uncharacterized protein n=1 Tax=Polarella glacialis TaxID=89957 RepID=A0A813GGJ9_POLGL|nr:unnamed protein product [Polarella glacialis]
MAVGWFGIVLHILGIVLILVFQESQLDTLQLIKSPMQQFAWYVSLGSKANLWGWAVILFYRFMLPSEDGVSLTFQLSASTNDDGGFKPAAILNRSLFLFAGILAMGSVFHTSLHTDESTLFPLAAVMRSKPFAYVAAPFWLASIVLFCFGVGFAVVQQRLSAGVWQVLPSVLAVILMLSACGSMLLILENERFTWIFALTFLLSFLPWVYMVRHTAQNVDRTGSVGSITYIVTGLIICGCAYFFEGDKQWVSCYLLLVWLCLYALLAPLAGDMFVTVKKLDKRQGQYDTLGASLP